MSQPEPSSPPPAAEDFGRAGRNLPAAIAVGVGLAGAVVATLLFWNWGFVLLAAAALAFGAHEVAGALARQGAHAATPWIVLGTLGIVVGSYFAGHQPRIEGLQVIDVPSSVLLLAALALTVCAALFARMPGGPEGFVRDASASLFVIGYVPLLGSFITLMLAGDRGEQRVIAFILTVAASDTGGYIAGVLFGRHQMAPVISPKKTWEGIVGSFVLAMVIAAICSVHLLGRPWWLGIILGVVCTSFGTVGDLVESLVKRDVGIKDMSSLLPGHGGIMDRIDSMLVAAPAAWLALYLLVPGG